MIENLDFEKNYWSRTAKAIYKIAHDSLRLLKWLAHSDRSIYENINYYNAMGSIVNFKQT